MKKAKALLEAYKIVNNDRQLQHGTPEDSFAAIAAFWSAYTGHQYTQHDVAVMMSLLKIARIKTGSGSRDSYIDLCGYGALAADMKQQEQYELQQEMQ